MRTEGSFFGTHNIHQGAVSPVHKGGQQDCKLRLFSHWVVHGHSTGGATSCTSERLPTGSRKGSEVEGIVWIERRKRLEESGRRFGRVQRVGDNQIS
jgi:hypothetical protein